MDNPHPSGIHTDVKWSRSKKDKLDMINNGGKVILRLRNHEETTKARAFNPFPTGNFLVP